MELVCNEDQEQRMKPSQQPRAARLDDYCVRRSATTDVDEQAAGLQHWEQEFVQLSDGKFIGLVADIWFGNIQIFRDQCNQSVHQSGKAWEGSRTIAHLTRAEGAGVFSGVPVACGDLVTLADHQPLDFRTPRQVDCIASTVDSAMLGEYAAAVWQRDIECLLPDFGRIRAESCAVREYVDLMLALYQSIVDSPNILGFALISRSMEEQIFDAVIGLGSGVQGTVATETVHRSRLQVVSKAREFMLDRQGESFTISDLCRDLSISRRSLQYAFETICDVNPVTYLKHLRLNSIRRELKRNVANPQCKIGDIAARFGFWHTSRFSAEYRQLFGELPSTTLGRSLATLPHA